MNLLVLYVEQHHISFHGFIQKDVNTEYIQILNFYGYFFRAFYRFNMIYTTRTENEPTIRVGSNGKIMS